MACRVEVFSRVTGFYQKVQSYNPGKVSEFHDRKTYKSTDGNLGRCDDLLRDVEIRGDERIADPSKELRRSLKDEKVYACQDA